jgi:hypothetical protein
MNDELERLRDVVRALVAERRAGSKWHTTMAGRMGRGEKPTEESIQMMRGLADAHYACQQATDAALARVGEVNPELVNG